MPTEDDHPHSIDAYAHATKQAHDGYWQYVGGRCSACKSISAFTLMRLAEEFRTEHLVEMTESEVLDFSETLQLLLARMRNG